MLGLFCRSLYMLLHVESEDASLQLTMAPYFAFAIISTYVYYWSLGHPLQDWALANIIQLDHDPRLQFWRLQTDLRAPKFPRTLASRWKSRTPEVKCPDSGTMKNDACVIVRLVDGAATIQCSTFTVLGFSAFAQIWCYHFANLSNYHSFVTLAWSICRCN